MARKVIFECDKCGLEEESDQLPEYWASAAVTIQLISDDMSEKTKVWCKECWKFIDSKKLLKGGS